MPHFPNSIVHSKKYEDDYFIYKHIMLTKEAFKSMKKNTILSEIEISRLGIIQSSGWEQYTIFKNEPNVMLFRKRKVL